MDHLKGVLRRILSSNAALRLGVQEARIVELWAEAVGPMISRQTRAVFMKGKTVFVEVDNPVWRQELFTNKSMVLKKYNQVVEQALGTGGTWVEDLFLLNPGSNPYPKNDRR